jgi:hypothetical protein
MKLSYGQSVYTPDPGTLPDGEDVICGVCGAVCGVKRNVNGPRGFVQAMSGGKSLHDTYICPHYELSILPSTWHGQAEKLMQEAMKCLSPTVAEIYAKDAQRIVDEKKPHRWKSPS